MVLTLPDNVLAWLRSLHPDPAWAIVSLFDKLQAGQVPEAPRGEAELVQVSGKRALIVVNPAVLKGVEGASIIPLADGRALIALDPEKNVADFELSLVDRLQRVARGAPEHVELAQFRQNLQRWRRVDGFRFHMRSIIVVERTAASHPIRTIGPVSQRTFAARSLARSLGRRQRRVK